MSQQRVWLWLFLGSASGVVWAVAYGVPLPYFLFAMACVTAIPAFVIPSWRDLQEQRRRVEALTSKHPDASQPGPEQDQQQDDDRDEGRHDRQE